MNDVADWWTTKIIRMEPGQIEFEPTNRSINSISFLYANDMAHDHGRNSVNCTNASP